MNGCQTIRKLSKNWMILMPKQDYEKKRETKRVSFNIEKDKELLEFANSVDFSNWVKQMIRIELDNMHKSL